MRAPTQETTTQVTPTTAAPRAPHGAPLRATCGWCGKPIRRDDAAAALLVWLTDDMGLCSLHCWRELDFDGRRRRTEADR